MAPTADDLSNALADAVQAGAASVARVEARRRQASSGILWSADGVILTAAHAIQREEGIRVGLPDGRVMEATLAGFDAGSDIALLRVEATDLTAAARGADEPRVGTLALAVGRPSDEPMASLGMISAVGGRWRTRRGPALDGYLRADLTMYPGFSGGALLDAGGRVLGMLTSRFAGSDGFAIPLGSATPIVEAILAGRPVRRGYLGVASQPVALQATVAETVGQETGLLVVSVGAGSASEAAGLLVGDILVRFDETPLRDPTDLFDVLGPDSVGKEAALGIIRGGEALTLQVTPAAREPEEAR